MSEYAILTTIQTGAIIVENGQAIEARIAPVTANWEVIKEAWNQGWPLQPQLEPRTYKGAKKIIIHDDPMEFDQEFKVFD